MFIEYFVGEGRGDGRRGEREVSWCKNGKRCSHCGINNKAKNVRNNPRKKEIFHVLAKQQQTNDKRVCR